MLRTLAARLDSFPLASPFRISRGVKTVAEVVTVEIMQDGFVGRGEGVPYARYGETIDKTLADINAASQAIESGATRQDINSLMAPGAARNAVDCALWDLESKVEDFNVATRLGVTTDRAVPTAMTVGLDAPAAMEVAARAFADVPLIKVKVDRSDPLAQIRAVRRGAPLPRMIVDPNESWTIEEVRNLQSALVDLSVDLLEQPLPSEDDMSLCDFRSSIPIAADESAHISGDMNRLADRYQVVNIKLDKSGGLTAALEFADAVTAHGLGLMVGCMISTSLSIAAALTVAARATFVDLDGSLWLSRDRPDGVVGRGGFLHAPKPGFWGSRSSLATLDPDATAVTT